MKPLKYSDWKAAMLSEDAEFKNWPPEKQLEAYEAYWTRNGGYSSYLERQGRP